MIVWIRSLVAVFAFLSFANSAGASEVLEGTLEVAYIENKSGSRIEYGLIQKDSQVHIKLKISSALLSRQFEHGLPVIVTGSYIAEANNSQFKVDHIILVEPESTQVNPAVKQIIDGVDRRAAMVILVDFNDAASSDYLTREYVSDTMYGSSKSVRATIEESSYGQVTFDEDVDGDGSTDIFQTTLNRNVQGVCEPSVWRGLATQQLQDSGVNISLYQHQVFIFPITTGCGNFRGLGTVGCRNTCFAEVITDQSSMYHTLTHELGHNLLFDHSNALNDNGAVVEYEDLSDFMSLASPSYVNGQLFEQSKVYQSNSVHRYFQGWLDLVPSSLTTIPKGIEQNIDLWVLDKDPRVNNVGTQIIRLPIDGSQDLFLSYRVLDQYNYKQFRNGEPFDRRVNIHRERSSGEVGGPGSSVRLGLIGTGETYVNQQAQIEVSVLSINDDYASVTVKYGEPIDQCISALPTLTSLKSAMETQQSGATLSYSFQLKNNDIGNRCEARDFGLQVNGDAVLSFSAIGSNVSLNPGETRTISVDVASTSDTAEGTYAFSLTATTPTTPLVAEASYIVSISNGDSNNDTETPVETVPVSSAKSDGGGGGSTGFLLLLLIGTTALSRSRYHNHYFNR